MFKKLLVANRGEIALRIVRACRELGIAAVAVYSEADRNSLHVRHADEAYLIGPAPARESYLNAARILKVAHKARVEAIHPGYGFLAENADFAEACLDAGIAFVGPSPRSIRDRSGSCSIRTGTPTTRAATRTWARPAWCSWRTRTCGDG